MSDSSIRPAAPLGSAIDQAGRTAIRNGSRSPDGGIANPARQFESILIAQWLEQAHNSFATVPGASSSEEGADPGRDQFRAIAFQSLASKVTEAGGFGIANTIVRQLGPDVAITEAADSPKRTSGNQET